MCEGQIQLKFEFEKSYKQRNCNDKTILPTLFSKHETHYHNFRSIPTNSELFFSHVDYESTILDPFLNSDQVLFLYINITWSCHWRFWVVEFHRILFSDGFSILLCDRRYTLLAFSWTPDCGSVPSIQVAKLFCSVLFLEAFLLICGRKKIEKRKIDLQILPLHKALLLFNVCKISYSASVLAVLLSRF